MNNVEPIFEWVLFRSLQLVLIFVLPLNAYSQTKSVEWREETKLASGQTIVIERSAKFLYAYNGNDNGWLFQNARIRALIPPSGTEVVWEGALGPLALDRQPLGTFI